MIEQQTHVSPRLACMTYVIVIVGWALVFALILWGGR